MQPWLVSVVVVAIVTMTSLFLGSFDSLELGFPAEAVERRLRSVA